MSMGVGKDRWCDSLSIPFNQRESRRQQLFQSVNIARQHSLRARPNSGAWLEGGEDGRRLLEALKGDGLHAGLLCSGLIRGLALLVSFLPLFVLAERLFLVFFGEVGVGNVGRA